MEGTLYFFKKWFEQQSVQKYRGILEMYILANGFKDKRGIYCAISSTQSSTRDQMNQR